MNIPSCSIDANGKTDYLTNMATKPLIYLPDPLLREISAPIERVDDELKSLVEDMLETMYDAPGIGLAAIQVGVPRRVLVIDVHDEKDGKNPLVFINPEIVSSSDDRRTYEEGCLSIPDYYAEVERPASVVVKHLDLDGEEHELAADGLLATCIQHELDHLDGVLFVDYLSKLKRSMVIKKFTKLARQRGTPVL